MKLKPDSKIVEFGPRWGNLTILFFESFRHSSDYLRVIKGLDKTVKDNGKV
jgi:hypothetical protein